MIQSRIFVSSRGTFTPRTYKGNILPTVFMFDWLRSPNRSGNFKQFARMSSPTASAAQRPGKRTRRPENVPGPLWVDTKCIDCDACRWLAANTFKRVGEASAVTSQPAPGTPEHHAALQALLSCPTFSIHLDGPAPGELAAARDSFPLAIPGTSACFHLGHHAQASYGAAPFLVVRGQGNIMIDVPRWSPQLAQRIDAVGGVKYIFLTHRDDVGDHERWANHLGAQRIIHSLEANARQGTE